MELLRFTPKGIYCEQGDFYIDPWRPVDKAIITHAHSDHARGGMKNYLTHPITAQVMKHRINNQLQIQSVVYNEKVFVNGVEVSLHPAGHIAGSAQVRVAYGGRVEVASGDYKLEYDGVSAAFEPVKCHKFITESTFGLPIYNWAIQSDAMSEIVEWYQKNNAEGITSVLVAYSLGKSQRLLYNLKNKVAPIYCHTTICGINQCLENFGFSFGDYKLLTPATKAIDLKGALIIAPSSFLASSQYDQLSSVSTAVVSGWMSIRGAKRRLNAEIGFAISDHADWKSLMSAIAATEADEIVVTHGYTFELSKYLKESGKMAIAAQTFFDGEKLEE